MRRKLAAILVVDMAGYSRLMGIDEAGTHAAFNRHLKEQIRPATKRHRGRLVKTLGDGALLEFDSAVDAVECAISLQDGFARRNRRAGESKQFHFRIGVNLGDVISEDGDVFGDGVNIAQRIEALAEPGDVLVSQTVVQHVRGKVRATFEDVGEREVKNIAEPVRVFRVIAEKAVDATKPAKHQSTPNPSIAILPFANMSGDPNQQYYGDGIAEDIITELSRFRTISVIARNSSFVYRAKAVDVKQIGRELGVEFVVEGSVRKQGDRIRITVQLINAESRRHVWADRYDVELSGIFAVQDDVTRQVVGALVPRLESEELESARRRPTGHPRAYESYLRGKALFYAAKDAAGIAEARRHFEEAVAIDPQFAAPYCFLVRIDNTAAKYTSAGASVAELRHRAWLNALKAAALDDSDPHTHISLAWCHLWRREFEAARKHLDIAMRLNPNDADRRMDCGTTLMYLGEPEGAIETMTGAMRLNPFHPDSYLADLAEAYFVAHRYVDAIATAEKIADPSPLFPTWKAAAYAYAGRSAEARQQADLFVSNMRAMWAGDPEAGEPDFVAWLLSFRPFRRKEDTEHLLDGLRRAGLDVTSAQPAAAPGP